MAETVIEEKIQVVNEIKQKEFKDFNAPTYKLTAKIEKITAIGEMTILFSDKVISVAQNKSLLNYLN